MNTHLPSSIRLPGGYVVTIKARAPSTLRKGASGECFGYWDASTRTIYVDKTVGERKQRYVLTHELMHAVTDWQHSYLGEDKA